MKGPVFHRNNCRLCSSKNIKCVLKLAPTPIGDAYVPKELINETQECFPVDIFLCLDCGLAQLLDTIDPKAVYSDYIYKTSDSLGLVKHFQRSVSSILNNINPPKGSLIVDIGSNDGSFLKFFQDQGMRVLGIDPAKDIAHKASQSGIETLPAFFNAELAGDIKKKHGPARIITSNNCFANIDNLNDLMKGILELLAPNGVFVFETGYSLDLIQKTIFDNIYHEHLSYFSVKPLESFFRGKDMELINVEYVSTKGGSIRCTVQRSGGSRKRLPSVSKLIELEENQGIYSPEAFKIFASKFDNIKNQTLSLLKNIKAKGKKIVGYGASVGVTTILYNFDLNKDLLDFLIDDNPGRQNLYSPGLHIPVLSPEELYKQNPDYVLLLAWQYSKQIIAKHQKYLDQGGNFILLLPQFRVVNKENWDGC